MKADKPSVNMPKSGSILIIFQEKSPAVFLNGDTDKKATDLVEFLTAIWSSWASNSDEETISCSLFGKVLDQVSQNRPA